MRRFGLAAFEDKRAQKQQYESVGGALLNDEAERLKSQVLKLQMLLRKYGREHSAEIGASPALRQQFAYLSARFGIDALSYADAGLATKRNAAGSAAPDYYYGLAVRVISICRATREQNGGIVGLPQMVALLAQDKFPVHAREADVVRAVEALAVFGPGLEIDTLPHGGRVIRSVPRELGSDQATVVAACDALGFVTVDMLRDNLGWGRDRCRYVVDDMVAAGLLWVDAQAQPVEYWSPSQIG